MLLFLIMKILYLLVLLLFVDTDIIYSCQEGCSFKNGCVEDVIGYRYCNPEFSLGDTCHNSCKRENGICVKQILSINHSLMCPQDCIQNDLRTECIPNPRIYPQPLCRKLDLKCPKNCYYNITLNDCVPNDFSFHNIINFPCSPTYTFGSNGDSYYINISNIINSCNVQNLKDLCNYENFYIYP